MATVLRPGIATSPHIFKPRRNENVYGFVASVAVCLVSSFFSTGNDAEAGPAFQRTVLYQSSYNTPLPLATAPVAGNPFFQVDWPVPRGPAPLNRSWSDSFKLPLTTVRGTAQYDWPNPRGPQPLNRGFTDSFRLLLQEPFNQFDWPVPKGSPPLLNRTFSDSFKLSLTTVKGTAQYDWPVPQGYRRNEQLGWFNPGLGLSTFVSYPAAITFDWPNPRGPAPLNLGFSDSFKLSLTTVKPPFTQYDWPVPKGWGPRQGWTDSYKLPYTTLPFAQHEWRNPVRHRQNKLQRIWIQRTDLPLITTFGVPPTYTQHDWPNPRGPQPLNRGFTDSFKLPLTTVKGKFNYDWPNPLRPRRSGDIGWYQPAFAALTKTFAYPDTITFDWPNPLRPHSNPWFVLRTPHTLALTTPVQPCVGVVGQQVYVEWRSFQTTGPNIVLKLTAPPVPPQPPVSHKPPKSHRGFAGAGGGRTDVASGSSTADVTSGSSKSDAQDP